MAVRTSPEALERAAVAAAEDALGQAGVRVRRRGTGLVIDAPGRDRVVLLIRGVSRLDGAQAQRLLDEDGRSGKLVVADELTGDAQDVLRGGRVGFFDRRGHLYLRTEALHLDLDVAPDPRHRDTRPAEPIRGRAGITVAAALLLDPQEPVGVRELARRTGLPVSTTSKALGPMRAAALIDGGRALVPELFWALADVWRPVRTALGQRPPAGAGVLTGTVAAAALGAPIAAATSSPPDLYVADASAVRALERRYGTSSAPSRAASVAVEPTPLVTQTAEGDLAHPLFVALDLAQDRARGREILEGWNPAGDHRVW